MGIARCADKCLLQRTLDNRLFRPRRAPLLPIIRTICIFHAMLLVLLGGIVGGG
jgi:hypothetical protein